MTSNINKGRMAINIASGMNIHRTRVNIESHMTKFRKSSIEGDKDLKMNGNNGSTIIVQTTTQPTTMSAIPAAKSTDDTLYEVKKEENEDTVGSIGKNNKPAGISYHKYDNPQNNLNIWRSKMVKAKPLASKINSINNSKLDLKTNIFI